MLVLLDRGLFSCANVAAVHAMGAQVLARLEAGMLTKPFQVLSDGSYLVELTPKTHPGLAAPLTLRVIEYKLDPKVAQRLAGLARSRNSRPADLDPDRLSFTHVLHVLDDVLVLWPLVQPQARPCFWQHVLAELRQPSTLLPPRRLRFNPRVLVLALTGVVDWHHHTGGSFTHVHLAWSFPGCDS